jgi:DNA-binding PadR family transcriptional regulator
MAELSDMELVILGVVWKRGPCTGYAVAKEFATSPSSHFSGSAGAVYPAVRRLARERYLEGAAGHQGRRRRRTYTITRRGWDALRRWLAPPVPEDAARITYDPIRTRAYFLAALPPKRRVAFLADAERQLRRQLPVIEAECERYREAGDEFSALAMGGGLYVIRARLKWITQMRRRLG